MQLLRSWGGEIDGSGASNGVTVSSANSGGGCGNAFNTVQITDATASCTFSTADKQFGLYSMAFATGAVAAQVNTQWNITAVPSVSFRAYVKTSSSFATIPSVFKAQGSGTQAFRVAIGSTGKLTIRDTANSTVATGTTTLSNSTWYRIEGFGTVGASSTFTVAYYTGNSGTAIEVLSISGQNFGTNNVDNVAFGQFAAIANMPTWLIDGIAIGDQAAFIGPYGTRANFNKTGRRVTYIKSNGKRRPAVVTGAASDGNPILRVRHIGETYGTASIGVPPRLSTASNLGGTYLTW